MGYHFKAACVCERGKVRSNNEDNFFFRDRYLTLNNNGLKNTLTFAANTTRTHCLAVFDGMGGEASGERASNYAAKALYHKMEEEKSCFSSARDFLESYYLEANRKICRAMERESNHARMGTTAAVLYINEDEVYASNVGDSRIYRYSDAGLQQLSRDHTDRALLEKVSAKSKPKLMQYLGIFESEMVLSPHIVKGKCHPGDRYLLCSDGLTDLVSDEQISAVLRKTKEVEDAVRELSALALSRGGKDNITIIVCEINRGHIQEESERNAEGLHKKTARTIVVCTVLSVLITIGIFICFFFRKPETINITIANEIPIGLIQGESTVLYIEVDPQEALEHLSFEIEDDDIARLDGMKVVATSPGTTRLVISDTRSGEELALREIRVFP